MDVSRLPMEDVHGAQQQNGGGGGPAARHLRHHNPAGDNAEVVSQRSADRRTADLSAGEATSLRSRTSTGHRDRRPPSCYRYVPPRKTNWQLFKDWFRVFTAWVFSNVGICVLVVAYLLVGAFMFQEIERPDPANFKKHNITIFR